MSPSLTGSSGEVVGERGGIGMGHSTSIIRLAAAVIVLTAGCAGQGARVGSALTQPEASASVRGADLEGAWRGCFGQVMTGDSGQIYGDCVCRSNGDGTYKTTWITRMVAGSARGGRLEMAGTVAAHRSRGMPNSSSRPPKDLKHH